MSLGGKGTAGAENTEMIPSLLSDGALGSVKVARANAVLLIAALSLAACQPPPPPPAGNYTVFDGQKHGSFIIAGALGRMPADN